MLDIKRIREDYEGVKKSVESRLKGDFGIGRVKELDEKRREILAEVEALKNKQNQDSKLIPVMKKEGKDTTELMADMKALSDKIKVLDGERSAVEDELHMAILSVPNTPYKDVQVGEDDSANVELGRIGVLRVSLILNIKRTGMWERILTFSILREQPKFRARDLPYIRASVQNLSAQ